MPGNCESRETGLSRRGIGKDACLRLSRGSSQCVCVREKESRVEFFFSFVERRRQSSCQSAAFSLSLLALLLLWLRTSSIQAILRAQVSDAMTASRRAAAALLAHSRALLGKESRLSSAAATSSAEAASQSWPLAPLVSTLSSSISTPGTSGYDLSDIEARGIAAMRGR